MRAYDTFIFDSYDLDESTGEIFLRYSLDDEIHFTETLVLPSALTNLQATSYQLQASLFALHLIGGISYYKTCLPKNIEIRSGSLTADQAAFWNSVYENGLGEFFYRNNIDFRGLINFPADVNGHAAAGNGRAMDGNGGAEDGHAMDTNITNKRTNEKTKKRILVPIGGGKDSIVTMELLKAQGKDCTLFRLGAHPLINEIAAQAGLPLMNVQRKLSAELFKLNEQGALNGHVPITAYLSFVTVLLSLLYDFDAVAMSSERSANIGNVEFHGKEINHQWSKSLEFERMFQDYVGKHITPSVSYFSLLRPLSELGIVKLFTQYPQYFPMTTSCNTNWKILKKLPSPAHGGGAGGGGLWCGICPKCAFVFALLAAFLSKAELTKMFGKNLFDDASLMPLYKELLGLEGFKPFECVGTPEETKAAFLLAHERGDLDDTVMMKMFLQDIQPGIQDAKALMDEALTPSPEQAIPKEFLSKALLA